MENNVAQLGTRGQFGRACDLIPLDLNKLGNLIWGFGGPDYSLLLELGVQRSDHIIVEVDDNLFDCGEFDDYTWTQANMVSKRGRYSGGKSATKLKWWRLPSSQRL